MSRALTFLFVLISSLTTLTSTFGQGRLSLAPTVSVGYRNLDYVLRFPGSTPSATVSGSYQTITGGLTAHYELSKHWSVSAGLLYNRYKGDDNLRSFSAASPVQESVRAITSENLQLPVLINYTGSSRRLSPYLSAGALLNYAYQTAYTDNGGSTRQSRSTLSDPNALRVQAMVGVGVQYRLSPAMSLIVQPTATYELGKRSGDYSTHRVYNVGLQTQLKFTF